MNDEVSPEEHPQPRTEKVVPTCKYGHGLLSKHSHTRSSDSVAYALLGVELQKLSDEATIWAKSVSVYTVGIYRCPICGYLEFFDDEADNG